jgi:hypothetical protein
MNGKLVKIWKETVIYFKYSNFYSHAVDVFLKVLHK